MASWKKHALVDSHPRGSECRRTDVAGQQAELRMMVARLDERDHPAGARPGHINHSAVARTNAVQYRDRVLDFVGVDVAAGNGHQIVRPTGDVQLAVVHESQVSRVQTG